eukprot:1734940-Rhodomonas_salina.1
MRVSSFASSAPRAPLHAASLLSSSSPAFPSRSQLASAQKHDTPDWPQQAEKDEEERVRKLRAQNAAHRKEIEAQMRSMHQYLLDGCEGWERGMTEFERKYNAEALAKAKRLKAAGMLRV